MLSQSRTHHGRVPGTWALSPLVGTPWWVWGETVETLSAIMSSKNHKTPSTSRQAKRSCPGSEDSDTDNDTSVIFPRLLIIETTDCDQSLNRLSPFVLGKALNAQIGTLKSVKRLFKGDILVETDKPTYSKMLLGLTQLAGVPVKVSPHRSLNVSRGVIRSRDIASCSVEEIVDEQGVTAVVTIHVRDGDSKRRTNTVILTFASPQPPKHITAGYMRGVPVDPYIPNPLRCFNCQKYGHSSRACKNFDACVKCGKAGHEGASCSNQEQCANCKGKHAASSRECTKWTLEKQVQQIKVERGISFPDARKAALFEQSTNTSSKRTAASVVSGTTTVTSQCSLKTKMSIATQTELTWPQGANTPVPVKTNSQTTQTHSNQISAKNTGIPPLLLLHQEVIEVQMLQ